MELKKYIQIYIYTTLLFLIPSIKKYERLLSLKVYQLLVIRRLNYSRILQLYSKHAGMMHSANFKYKKFSDDKFITKQQRII